MTDEGRPEFLAPRADISSDFRATNPALLSLGEDLLWVEWRIYSAISHMEDAFSSIVGMLLRQLHAYHHEALFQCMSHRQNIGMALVRMSCEVARDVTLLAREPQLETLWLKRERRRIKYREEFKFERFESSVAQGLRDLYRLTSSYGVHGHMEFLADPIGTENVGGKDYVLIPPNENHSKVVFGLALAAIHLSCHLLMEELRERMHAAADSELKQYLWLTYQDLTALKVPPEPAEDLKK